MSVYIQEVLGLLKRGKKKKKLDKVKDHFEFGKLYQNSTINTGAAYNPKMEPFVVKWGDLVCEATEDLTRTQPGSGNLGFVPVYTSPEGTCSWDTLKDSIITQNAIGDTINIAGDLYVDGTITTPTLTEDRIVIVGPGGVLEDDANFTMDGITFTAIVNVQHGSITASPTVPTTTTTLNSNIVLNGPITDSQGNVGQLSQVLVGLGDGRVVWSDDDVVEALTYGSLWQGNVNNLKQELAIGTADQILISDGTTFAWQDNPAAIIGEACAIYRIPLYTPTPNTLGCSLLIQDGDSSLPASVVINEGNMQIQGTTKLDTVSQDDTLTQVLVRDPANANLVKWRDALTISPALGWDTVDPDAGVSDWNVVFFNGYMEVTTPPNATRGIRPNNLTDAQEGYFVFVANRSDIPLDFLQFTGVNGGTPGFVRTTWSGSGNNVYTPTAQSGGYWQYGTAVKFHYIVRFQSGQPYIWWDACCEIAAQNECPIGTATSFTIAEDTPTGTLSLPATDDGLGVLSWSIIQQPLDSDGVTSAGTIALDSTTGTYVFTPALNYYGSGTFTWQVSDGYCVSDVITVNFTVTAVSESPVFQVYNGVGAVCGAASVAPVFTGTVGGAYLYEGHYCDPDHDYTQVTLTVEYSSGGAGGPWIAGLPANFALVKDDLSGVATPWRFTFTSSSVPSGQTCFRLTLQDPDGNTNQQIFCVSAAFDILLNMQFQLEYQNQPPNLGANSKLPVAQQNNLSEYSAPLNIEGITLSGFPLHNPTTMPTFSNSNSLANSITATGTYPGNTLFTLFVNNNVLEAAPFSGVALSNAAVGQTVIFTQAQLNAALPSSAPFSGNLVYTLREEDITYAPNNGNTPIPLAQNAAMANHNCNDGGFGLTFRGTDASGNVQTFKSRRFSSSNGGSTRGNSTRFYSADAWAPPLSYITQGLGANAVWWSRSRVGGSFATYYTNMDTTTGGIIYDNRNCQAFALPGYFETPATYTVTSDRTSGLFSLPNALALQLAASASNGIVTMSMVGDTWARAAGNNNATIRVDAVDASGAITASTLSAGGTGYAGINQANSYFATTGGSGSDAFFLCAYNGATGTITTATPWNLYPGTGYQVGDLLTVDGPGTAYANTHGDAAAIRIFREDPANPGSHIEVGINPATGRTLQAGDGTSIQVDLFNNTVTVV
jgi:hypothetical protein|tara:strand:- start:398 stop:3904 length:3507 start_codon:yes stop_codon:yes gene_type:complete